MNSIGDRLREERTRLGFSQTDFAEKGGVQRRAQVNYEAGERFPDAVYLAAIAGIGTDVLYVITGKRVGVEEQTPPRLEEPNWDLICVLVEGVEVALATKQKRLSPRKKVELLRVLYKHFAESAPSDQPIKTPGFDKFMEAILATL